MCVFCLFANTSLGILRFVAAFVLWYANFFSIVVVSGLAMHALWPMVSLSLGWSIPSFYYIKVWVVCFFFKLDGLCGKGTRLAWFHDRESVVLRNVTEQPQ